MNQGADAGSEHDQAQVEDEVHAEQTQKRFQVAILSLSNQSTGWPTPNLVRTDYGVEGLQMPPSTRSLDYNVSAVNGRTSFSVCFAKLPMLTPDRLRPFLQSTKTHYLQVVLICPTEDLSTRCARHEN
jgi:hypothetical protein